MTKKRLKERKRKPDCIEILDKFNDVTYSILKLMRKTKSSKIHPRFRRILKHILFRFKCIFLRTSSNIPSICTFDWKREEKKKKREQIKSNTERTMRKFESCCEQKKMEEKRGRGLKRSANVERLLPRNLTVIHSLGITELPKQDYRQGLAILSSTLLFLSLPLLLLLLLTTTTSSSSSSITALSPRNRRKTTRGSSEKKSLYLTFFRIFNLECKNENISSLNHSEGNLGW